MDCARVILLGTGTPHPLPHRAGSGFWVEMEGKRYLVDCGPGVLARILQAGLSPLDLDGILLTHLHYDHCVDFASTALIRWDQGGDRKEPLPVLGPPGTARFVEQLFSREGVFGPDLQARTEHPSSQFVFESRGGTPPREWPRFEVTELDEQRDPLALGPFYVTALRNVHAEPQLVTLAYRLQSTSHSLVFGADGGPNPALPRFADACHLLVHMCHFMNDDLTDPRVTTFTSGHLDAARIAQEAKARRLALVHFTPTMEGPEWMTRLEREAKEVYHGELFAGYDLMPIDLP